VTLPGSQHDPAEQLQALYVAGFDLETFERYPKSVAVVRGECIALLVPGPDGLQILGSPGWKIGSELAVLTTVEGKPVFQFKQQMVEATEERRNLLQVFRDDLIRIMRG
jgi:hypothetical protein